MSKIIRLLNDARSLLQREARDLAAFDFSRLKEFAASKARLADVIEKTMATLDRRDSPDIIAALDDVRRKALENAALFDATRQGFADAKSRLLALRQPDTAPCFYGEAAAKAAARTREKILRDI